MKDQVKTFCEHINEEREAEIKEFMIEAMNTELSPEDEALVEAAYQYFCESEMTLEELNNELTNEGIFGSLLGGLTGFALGKSVGKMIARALGIKSGVFYDLLTSRLVGTALGSSIGKKMF